MRFVRFAALALLAVGFSTSTALASSPHFKHGGEPTCTITGTTSKSISCSGALSGLGGEDLGLFVTTSGFAVYQCQNNGGQVAPGQNRVLEGPTTTPTIISGNAIKNGNLAFTAPGGLSAATTVSGTAAGCPNPTWTGVNPTLTVTNITLRIEQPLGTTIFTCTASNPNGLTSPVTLAC